MFGKRSIHISAAICLLVIAAGTHGADSKPAPDEAWRLLKSEIAAEEVELIEQAKLERLNAERKRKIDASAFVKLDEHWTGGGSALGVLIAILAGLLLLGGLAYRSNALGNMGIKLPKGKKGAPGGGGGGGAAPMAGPSKERRKELRDRRKKERRKKRRKR